jgi:hypothetical protein
MRGFRAVDEVGPNLQDQARSLPALQTSALGGTRSARFALISEAQEEQSMRDVAGHKVETAVEARAGFLDRPVLVVLCVSLALGAVVLGALWLGLT